MSAPPKVLRIIVIVSLALGAGLTVFFGLRAIHSFMRFRRMPRQPISTDVSLIRGWMTIGFIAHNYHVPPDYLAEAVGVTDQKYRTYTLIQINQELYPGRPGAVLKIVQDAITAYWVQHPPPPAPPTPPAPPAPPGDWPTSTPAAAVFSEWAYAPRGARA